VQRVSSTESIREAAREGRIVVACAYDSHLPAELRDVLPARAGEGYIAVLREGQPPEIIAGAPEMVLHSRLAAKSR
jgi:hypothetical protein